MLHFGFLFTGQVLPLASVTEEGDLNRGRGSVKKPQDLTMTVPEKQKTTKSR